MSLRHLALAALLLTPLLASPSPADPAPDLQESLRRTLAALSAPACRMTGYPGILQAGDWLTAELKTLGIEEIYRHEFPVPVPVDEGFRAEADGESLRLYGVWPNLVRTPTLPPGGLEGPLADGGDGSGLEGQPVAGRIVLLDYDSGRAWVDAFHLGAAAVVLLESAGAHGKEAELKFLDVPADLPRLYARAPEAGRLRQLAREGARVRLSGRMTWRQATGRNLVAVVEGRDPALRGEAVLLTAYYDAVSPVPALAPGAEQASGAAALLELARRLAARPPARTVVLLWTAGHFQNLAGMRHFTPLLLQAAGRREDQVEDSSLLRRLSGLDLRFVAGLDLSARSSRMGVFRPRDPYRTSLLVPPVTSRILELAAAYEDSAAGGALQLVNGLKPDLSRQGLGGLALTVPLDASVAALAGCPALAFVTVNDSRAGFDSPTDFAGQVDCAGLARQVDLLAHLVSGLAGDPRLPDWAWGDDAFGTVHGDVVHYGPRSYLPDQPTAGALVRVRLRQPTLSGVRPDFLAVAGDSGRYRIPGLESGIIYTQPVRLEAYGLDAETGAVTQAPDWGVNGERRLPRRTLTVTMDGEEEEVQIVTAPLRGTALLSLFDPRNLITPERLQVIDAALEAEPPVFGACLPLTAPEMELFGYRNRVGSWTEPVGVLFARPGTRFKAVMSTGRYGLGRRLLLVNGSPEAPGGAGYAAEQGRLPETAHRVAADMHGLNGERIEGLLLHGVRNARLAAFHERSGELLREAGEARLALRHRDSVDRARRAWALAAAAYREVEGTRSGVVQGALFLLAALIPFAHFAERLLFGFVGLRRQVAGYFVLFLLGFVALRYLHPAFELSISPVIILLGFVTLSLGILVATLGVGRLNRELRELAGGRRARAGVQRSGAVLASVAVGLAQMRRRPWRTGLTCATLVMLTFSVLSFTSIRDSLRTNRVDIGEGAAYDGALVRMPGWKTMEREGWRMLRDWFGADRVSPRAWMTASSAGAAFRVERQGPEDRAVGVLGFAGDQGLPEAGPAAGRWLRRGEEKRAVGVQGFAGLTAGDEGLLGAGVVAGRWLRPGEEDACLLPVALADSLGITAGGLDEARLRIFGEVFRVAGLLAPGALDRPDLNGEPLTPLDPEAQQPREAEVGGEGGEPLVFAHLPGNSTLVLPFAALMRWEGASLTSVSIRLGGGREEIRRDLEELARTLDLNLFGGLAGRRLLINTVGAASVSGLAGLAVPLLIAALIVLNTMLGAVWERTREIGTFNAVGLAPAHVSGLFMAEAVALGVVGAVAGYLLGQTAAQLLGHRGWLQGLELNYSSLAAVLTLGSVVLLVAASALYPAHLAGRICTPGIERRWSLPAGFGGDRLEVPLPFSLPRGEALGLAAFQAEFWAEHREQSIGAGFYVESIDLSREDDRLGLAARVWLAPFDQGVVQRAELRIRPGQDPRFCDLEMGLELLEGDPSAWRRVVRTFLDDVRQQFLVWRTLDEEERRRYAAELPRWEGAGSVEAEAEAAPA
ncbi:MAG: FtsX-like permease family protein [Gemmatimonadaceae bacterium]|nr:FtsX-like permease family protein [Gemmatimonadaceae bacterium]